MVSPPHPRVQPEPPAIGDWKCLEPGPWAGVGAGAAAPAVPFFTPCLLCATAMGNWGGVCVASTHPVPSLPACCWGEDSLPPSASPYPHCPPCSSWGPLGAPSPQPQCKTPPMPCMVLLALLQRCSLSSALLPVLRTRGVAAPPPPNPFGAVGLSAKRRAALLLSLPITPKRVSVGGGLLGRGLSCPPPAARGTPQCPSSPAALHCTAHCWGGFPWSTAGLGYGVPLPSPHPPMCLSPQCGSLGEPWGAPLSPHAAAPPWVCLCCTTAPL